jgi:hypothetical protein
MAGRNAIAIEAGSSAMATFPACLLHVAEVTAVLAGGNLQGSLKDVAHRIDIPKATFGGDRFHAICAFLQATPSGFDPQALDQFRRGGFHFPAEDSSEIPRAHPDPLRQDRDGERLVQVIKDPRFQFPQWFSIAQLQRKGGAELRLAAGAPQIEDEIARDLKSQARTMVLLNQGEGQVHPGCNPRGGIDIFVAHEYRVRVNLGPGRAFD